MGVWTSGPRSRALALQDSGLRAAFNKVLPDWTEDDVAGSPYAIGAYEVPASLGGESGLNSFRTKLNQRGLKLLLDFVPNHLGLDHPWAAERPELFVQLPPNTPGSFEQQTKSGIRWLAHGKDPYFAPWTDTIQLDYRRAETRVAMTELLLSIASRCDGVRCDMAMLLLNDVFEKNWTQFPPPATPPASEFWADAISEVKSRYPGFVFLGEVYWGLQGRLQELEFDFTYDKDLYDQLIARRPAEVRRHLFAVSSNYLERSAHFLENHDERRIAEILSFEEHRAAALLMLGLPGMRFLHEGQLSGKRIHVPVQRARVHDEPVDANIQAFYDRLLTILNSPFPGAHNSEPLGKLPVGRGEFKILQSQPFSAGGSGFESVIAIQWEHREESPGGRERTIEFAVIVVNLSPDRIQCRLQLSVPGLADHGWELRDLLGDVRGQHVGGTLAREGLLLDLPGSAAQLLFCRPFGG
jgi:hypothetical protein